MPDYEGICKKYAGRKNERFSVGTAGHPESRLFFQPFSQCGEIDDGVSFSHGDKGGWVISFTALEKIYEAAKWFRREPKKVQEQP